MFAAAFHTSPHYILLTAMACLCVLLGGPSYPAGADSLFIAGVTYYEPDASSPDGGVTCLDGSLDFRKRKENRTVKPKPISSNKSSARYSPGRYPVSN